MSYYTIGKSMYISKSNLNLCCGAFSHCNRWAVNPRMYGIKCLLIYVHDCKQIIKKELFFPYWRCTLLPDAWGSSEGDRKVARAAPTPNFMSTKFLGTDTIKELHIDPKSKWNRNENYRYSGLYSFRKYSIFCNTAMIFA